MLLTNILQLITKETMHLSPSFPCSSTPPKHPEPDSSEIPTSEPTGAATSGPRRANQSVGPLLDQKKSASADSAVDFLRGKFKSAVNNNFDVSTVKLADIVVEQAKSSRAHPDSGSFPNSNDPKECERLANCLHLYAHMLTILQDLQQTNEMPLLSKVLEGVSSPKQDTRLLTPVITSHPTRMSHPGFAPVHTEILECMSRLKKAKSPEKIAEIEGRLNTAIEKLCKMPSLRAAKLTVNEEHAELMVTAYPTISKTVKKIANALPQALSGKALGFGTWSGSDHDGHPGVTAAVLESTVMERSGTVLHDYVNRVAKLSERVHSGAIGTKPVSALDASQHEKIINLVNHFEQINNLPASTPNSLELNQEGLIGKAIDHIHARLKSTESFGKNESIDQLSPPYTHPDQLQADIAAISDVFLEENKTIKNLQHKISTFGFHYAPSDLRQNASVFHVVANDLLQHGLKEGERYALLPEKEKILLLTEALKNPERLNTDQITHSDQTISELALIKKALTLRTRIGEDVIGYQIIANTEKQSDMLEAMLAVVVAGGFDEEKRQLSMPIVPLFETIDDLKNSSIVMSEFFETCNALDIAPPKGIHPVMVGYSDSNKDGGIFAARRLIFKAVKDLAEVAKNYEKEIVIFHGNGGSEARGGGNIEKAIAARSPLGDTMRYTIQGENAHNTMPSSELGAANFANYIKANDVRRSGSGRELPKIHDELMDTLAELSEAAYRKLHDDPVFAETFFALSDHIPIKMIHSGSRPGTRQVATASLKERLAGVRAINHNLTTTAARMLIQGFYGFGTSVDDLLEKKPDAMHTLKEMYQTNAEFHSTLLDIETTLAKVNPSVAEEIFDGLPDETKESGKKFFSAWRTDFDRSKSRLLEITDQQELLEKNPATKTALDERLAVADAISTVMTRLLKERKDAPEDLVVSISAVLTALRNAG